MASYTVRIVSHKCDLISCKRLVNNLSELSNITVAPGYDTKSVFELERVVGKRLLTDTVTVLECTYVAGMVIDRDTIVFADLTTGSAAGKRAWAEHIVKGTSAATWMLGKRSNGELAMYLGELGRPERQINIYGALDYEIIWFRHLAREFGIVDPIMTTISLLNAL